MKRKIILIAAGLAIVFSVLFLVKPLNSCFAKEDNLEELKQQIQELQKRINILESEKKESTIQQPGSQGLRQVRVRQVWDPLEEMLQMQQEMNQMFKNSFKGGGLSSKGMFSSDVFYDDAFGLKDDKDKYIIEFDMQGFNPSKMNIQVNNRTLTVKGERSEAQNEDQKNKYFSSQSYASFMRSLVLPEDADTTKMKSENKGDKLIVTLPKKKM